MVQMFDDMMEAYSVIPCAGATRGGGGGGIPFSEQQWAQKEMGHVIIERAPIAVGRTNNIIDEEAARGKHGGDKSGIFSPRPLKFCGPALLIKVVLCMHNLSLSSGAQSTEATIFPR